MLQNNVFVMETSISTQYYLKALSAYPWSPEEVIEMVAYALSYDDEYAPSLCLMGKIQMEYLKDFNTAAHYFNRALIANKNYVETYKQYSLLLIWLGDLNKAELIIRRAETIKGMDKTLCIMRRATIAELKGDFALAVKFTKLGRQLSLNNEWYDYFNNEKIRLKRKIKKT